MTSCLHCYDPVGPTGHSFYMTVAFSSGLAIVSVDLCRACFRGAKLTAEELDVLARYRYLKGNGATRPEWATV